MRTLVFCGRTLALRIVPKGDGHAVRITSGGCPTRFLVGTASAAADFRAHLSAASLKPSESEVPGNGNKAFPRSSERGLIEARWKGFSRNFGIFICAGSFCGWRPRVLRQPRQDGG